jgi:hypothetical protein
MYMNVLDEPLGEGNEARDWGRLLCGYVFLVYIFLKQLPQLSKVLTCSKSSLDRRNSSFLRQPAAIGRQSAPARFFVPWHFAEKQQH